ncbi:MAG: FtsX-like permease family protein [Cyclobacteriaceae bacterium]
MLKLFLKSAQRNFTRNKAFTLINILGLSLGIASSILIFIVVKYELSFDKYQSNYENIYRVNIHSKRPSGVDFTTACPAPAATAFKQEFPEVNESALVQYRGEAGIRITTAGKEVVYIENSGIVFVGSEFTRIFDYSEVTGTGFSILDEPNKALVTERIAEKYFPGTSTLDAVGKTFRYEDEYTIEIAGILENIPDYTDIAAEILISRKTIEVGQPEPNWGRIDTSTQVFLLMNNPVDIDAFDARIKELVTRQTSERYAAQIELHLQPLSTIHYDGRFGNFNNRTSSKESILAIALIGLVLMLTACINFINLATAQSIKRAKEVGIRKIIGSSKLNIVNQMLTETTLIVVVSTLIGVAAAWLYFPYLTSMLNLNIAYDHFYNPIIPVFIMGIGLVIIMLSGVYPGWVLSRFNPLQTLKGSSGSGSKGGLWLRRALVIFQFATSQALIIGTIVVSTQIDYFTSKNLGFNKESVLIVQLPDEFSADALRNEWEKIPFVSNITFQAGAPSSTNRWMTSYNFPGSNPDDRYFAEMKAGDEHYFDTYQLKLLAGKNYHKLDSASETLINEKMALEMGYASAAEAVGNKVHASRNRQSTIVGVVENFHTVSLHEEIPSVMIIPEKENYYEAGIRFNSDKISETLTGLEKAWNTLEMGDNFNYAFLDDTLDQFYEDEQRVASMFNAVTFVAIFIGCLGLYGLIAFMTNNRMREVGIRKVLGADIFTIINLFSKEFVRLVIIAFLIAAPLGYYYMDIWLSDFVYRIDISFWIFVLAIASSLLIALGTVVYRSYVAARINPVDTLRYE